MMARIGDAVSVLEPPAPVRAVSARVGGATSHPYHAFNSAQSKFQRRTYAKGVRFPV
jgi:hypothetical protein